MLELDGAYGEGGGQIVRTALLLSLLTGRPFRAYNIRKGRSKPGLKPQHLHIVRTLLHLTSSRAEGAHLGSLELTFFPGPIGAGTLRVDIGTAGSISLFLQTLLPVSCFASGPVHLRVRGGTDVPGGMTFAYLAGVLVPFVRPFVRELRIQALRRGFYPKGGGEVELQVVPRFSRSAYPSFEAFREALRGSFRPLRILRRGTLRRIRGESLASTSLRNRRVAERQAGAARRILPQADIQVTYSPTLSPGSALTLIAEFEYTVLGADALGRRGVPAETVGQEAAEKLQAELEADATVDVHLSDNLIPWLALVGGAFRVREITSHTRTNIWVVEQFLGPTFRIRGREIWTEG